MRLGEIMRSQIGGYQGPVVVLALSGEEIARAACRYRAQPDNQGVDQWRGSLHRIEPAGAVVEGSYRLRFPEGEQGEVTIAEVSPTSEMIFFAGSGSRPLFPL
jgi:hypothetical protein